MNKLIMLILSLLIACSTERVAPEAKIGEEFGGGIVFYLLKEGDIGYNEDTQHGFIVALKDEIDSKWGCYEADLHEMSSFIGDGDINSGIIVDTCPGENAAYQCIISTQGKQFDWYLPNLNEFKLLIDSNIGNLSLPSYYWVSSKQSNFDAFCIRPNDKNTQAKDVNYFEKVRAIRKF